MLKKGDLVYFVKRGNSANGHLLEKEEVDKSGGPGLVLAVWDEKVVLTWKENPEWTRFSNMGTFHRRKLFREAKIDKHIPDQTEMRTVAKIHWQKPRKVQTKFSTGEDNKHITVDFVERYVKVEDC